MIVNSTRKKKIIWLIVIYTLSQLLLCFVSGQWWDDWGVWGKNTKDIINLWLEHGTPTYIISFFSVMWIPNWGYRFVVFFLYLVDGILAFLIICESRFFSEKDAFYIAAVAITVPVNDARITLICFDYAWSLALFSIGFYWLLLSQGRGTPKKIFYRILSLFFLFWSYSLESLLVFTGVIWIYIIADILRSNKCNFTWGYVLKDLNGYLSFFALPFLFYFIKNTVFKPYGRYSNYNSVTIQRMYENGVNSLHSLTESFKLVVNSYINQISFISIGLFVAAVICLTIKNREVDKCEKRTYCCVQINRIVLGVIVYFAGMFAHIVVRDGLIIRNTAIDGRDMMLAGYGIAIIAVSFSNLFSRRTVIQRLLPVLLIILGSFHFNNWYLKYQEDWFYQVGFANAIIENDLFKNDNTILCDFATPSPIEGTRFYTLNGMYRDISGKQDKFFFSDISELKYGVDFKDSLLYGYNCDDYKEIDTSIDGVLLIDNCPFENIEIVRMRFYELVNNARFEEEIKNRIKSRYIEISEETSELIYRQYLERKLNSDLLREWLESRNN